MEIFFWKLESKQTNGTSRENFLSRGKKLHHLTEEIKKNKAGY